jgi:hypothetical protein
MQKERKPTCPNQSSRTIIPSTNMAINHEDISQSTVSELHQVADWMESRTAQQSGNIIRRNDKKTRGDGIRLLT